MLRLIMCFINIPLCHSNNVGLDATVVHRVTMKNWFDATQIISIKFLSYATTLSLWQQIYKTKLSIYFF